MQQVFVLMRTYVLQRSGSDTRGTDFKFPAYTSLLYILATSLMADWSPYVLYFLSGDHSGGNLRRWKVLGRP
jgi:hypothetical protein